jgi:hypothetical protein
VCPAVFDRVVVSYLTKGGTSVYWTLHSTFRDPLPYTFQLRVGQSNDPLADDWEDVGGPITNMFFATDGQQRDFSKYNYQYYSVQLTTSQGTYYSEPTALQGTLSAYDWRIGRELVRQERLRMRMRGGGQEGYLLKRRISGTPCPVCLDTQTREVRNPDCPVCWGTGWECGYFFPMACIWADMNPKTYYTTLDGQRGTVKPMVCKARMVHTWMMQTEDVFVVKKTDDRFYVHQVQNSVEIRGVPLVAEVELRLAPATDPIYNLPIPDQLNFEPYAERNT